MTDETQFTEKPKTTVETQTTTTSRSIGKTTPPDESQVWGASGRFWITFMLAIGVPLLPILWLVSAICGVTIDATMFLGIFTAYIGTAGTIIGAYIGQKTSTKQQG